MYYKEYLPHPLLSQYIEVYWSVRGEERVEQVERYTGLPPSQL
jgi:hypothetical protein